MQLAVSVWGLAAIAPEVLLPKLGSLINGKTPGRDIARLHPSGGLPQTAPKARLRSLVSQGISIRLEFLPFGINQVTFIIHFS